MVGAGNFGRRRQVGQRHHVFVEPFSIRMGRGERVFQLLVVDDLALLEVDQEHLSRLEPPFPDDPFRRDLERAHFRRHDHAAVVGLDVTAGTQAVAIEDRADRLAIGERDRRRAVPRLHQAAMIAVEVFLGLRHRLVVFPRLGDEHHHGVRQAVPRAHQKLDGVIKAGRIAQAPRE